MNRRPESPSLSDEEFFQNWVNNNQGEEFWHQCLEDYEEQDQEDDEMTGEYFENKPPTRLQDLRDFFYPAHAYQLEEDLYVHTYNSIIDIKLEQKLETRNLYLTDRYGRYRKKTKFAKTRESDKVGSYSYLQRKYKPNTLKTLRLKLRKLILYALKINPTELYKAESWVSFISGYQNLDQIVHGDEYPEFEEALREALVFCGYPI